VFEADPPKPPGKIMLFLLRYQEPALKVANAWNKPELGQRHLVFLFVLGLVGSISFFSMVMSRLRVHPDTHAKVEVKLDPAKALEEMARKKAQLLEAKQSMVDLGLFDGTLVSVPGGTSGVHVELEIAVEFDSGATGSWVSANLGPARSATLGAVATLSGLSRKDLLTAEGKERIRDQVRSHIDDFLPSGRVKDVYFSKYVVH